MNVMNAFVVRFAGMLLGLTLVIPGSMMILFPHEKVAWLGVLLIVAGLWTSLAGYYDLDRLARAKQQVRSSTTQKLEKGASR